MLTAKSLSTDYGLPLEAAKLLTDLYAQLDGGLLNEENAADALELAKELSLAVFRFNVELEKRGEVYLQTAEALEGAIVGATSWL